MILKRILPALAVVGLLAATPVFAAQCPVDMGKIDEAMKTAKLSEADMAEVMRLRAEGEAEHNGGEHAKSVETLAKAKAILKVE
ncbi:MAG: hypothetical protein FJX66_02550 [Alphaproteobacteria bacterium]|nr:hypothetical protein [Alphaproteobacteria bacterium]